MSSPGIDEQRTAFGKVAELYDRARPSYPAATIDDLLEVARLGPGAEVLEVGAGTGRATCLLAERGLIVTALEPDPAMASIARRNCPAHAAVRIEHASFEEWRPVQPVQAVVSFQAWHWTDPTTRYERAASALRQGGSLAAVWTFPEWGTTSLRDRLRANYVQAAPDLTPHFPMHPGSEPVRLAGDWERETSAGARFRDAQVRLYPWTQRYSGAEYRALLETHQDHILMPDEPRKRLLSAVQQTVEAAGAIELDFVTRLCIARLA